MRNTKIENDLSQKQEWILIFNFLSWCFCKCDFYFYCQYFIQRIIHVYTISVVQLIPRVRMTGLFVWRYEIFSLSLTCQIQTNIYSGLNKAIFVWRSSLDTDTRTWKKFCFLRWKLFWSCEILWFNRCRVVIMLNIFDIVMKYAIWVWYVCSIQCGG